jgi:hypothetical protein
VSYEKQIWNQYDDLKTEEENIENGAVVTDNRMNHIEEGVAAHTADLKNPHKVTAAQVGLGDVQNFGLATEDEAKQGTSNAKYMTPSLTQAVLSANINSIAYANSADGTDGFTTVYPNLNLLDGTEDFSGTWTNSSSWVNDGTYKGLAVKKRTAQWSGIYKTFTVPKDGTYTFSAYIKSSGNTANVFRYGGVNTTSSQPIIQKQIGNNFDWTRDSVTLNLKANDSVWIRYEISGAGTDSILWVAGYKYEPGSTATPWMPSASEVTTADWPKYVGFSNTVKTNKSASDYTWFPVKDSELTNKVESHINNKSNPHSVTASQVGAYSKTEADSKLALKANDSEVIHNTGDETIAGKKVFTEALKVNTVEFAGDKPWVDLIPATGFTADTYFRFRCKVSGGNLMVDIRGLKSPSTIAARTAVVATTIPEEYRPSSNRDGAITFWAAQMARVEINSSTGALNVVLDAGTTSTHAFQGTLIVPMN